VGKYQSLVGWPGPAHEDGRSCIEVSAGSEFSEGILEAIERRRSVFTQRKNRTNAGETEKITTTSEF
jgi:hypothetical protein